MTHKRREGNFPEFFSSLQCSIHVHEVCSVPVNPDKILFLPIDFIAPVSPEPIDTCVILICSLKVNKIPMGLLSFLSKDILHYDKFSGKLAKQNKKTRLRNVLSGKSKQWGLAALTDKESINIFADLIRSKLGLYRAIAVKIVHSAADADDAVQSALLKAWNRRTSFRSDPAALSGWISRIVVTESYDLLRKKMREQKKLALYRPDGDDTENPALCRLDDAIAALPELYRETIHIAVLSGLNGESAARELGCSANTLYQRIHKAKKLLKEALRRNEDE